MSLYRRTSQDPPIPPVIPVPTPELNFYELEPRAANFAPKLPEIPIPRNRTVSSAPPVLHSISLIASLPQACPDPSELFPSRAACIDQLRTRLNAFDNCTQSTARHTPLFTFHGAWADSHLRPATIARGLADSVKAAIAAQYGILDVSVVSDTGIGHGQRGWKTEVLFRVLG